MRSMNFTKEDQHDLWINDPFASWNVSNLWTFCSFGENLKIFSETSHTRREILSFPIYVHEVIYEVWLWGVKNLCEPGIRIPPLLPSWYRNTGKMRFHRLSQPDLSTSYWWDLNCAKVPPVHPQTRLTKVKPIWISVGGWLDCSLTNKLVLNEANKYKKNSLFRYRMGGDNKHFQLCLGGCTMYILSYVISICSGQVKRCLGCSNHGKCRGCCIWKQKPKKYLNWINHFNLNKLCWLIDLALLKQTIALHQSWVAPYNQDLCYMLCTFICFSQNALSIQFIS